MKSDKSHIAATIIGLVIVAGCSFSQSLIGMIAGCTFLICGELGAIRDEISKSKD